MLTHATITDYQIKALRERASEHGEGISTREEDFGAAEILNVCDEALGDFEYGEQLVRDMTESWFAMRKRDARDIVATVINHAAEELTDDDIAALFEDDEIDDDTYVDAMLEETDLANDPAGPERARRDRFEARVRCVLHVNARKERP